jgi:hypothetical protein
VLCPSIKKTRRIEIEGHIVMVQCLGEIFALNSCFVESTLWLTRTCMTSELGFAVQIDASASSPNAEK